MSENDMIKTEKLVDRLYEDFDLEFPITDPRELIPKFGGIYEPTSSYKIGDDEIAVIKHRAGFTIAVCEAGMQYDIDPWQKARTDELVCRAIGQLMIYMGFYINPRRWEAMAYGLHRYKDIRYAKYIRQIEYFANALMLPKRVFTNAMIHNTRTGYRHGVDVRTMAEELNTTPQMVMERGKKMGFFINDISISKI